MIRSHMTLLSSRRVVRTIAENSSEVTKQLDRELSLNLGSSREFNNNDNNNNNNNNNNNKPLVMIIIITIVMIINRATYI